MKNARFFFSVVLVVATWSAASLALADSPNPASKRLNILFITADDLHCESVGAFGGKIADLTPNIDRLASEGMRFNRAHVNAAICQPSRGVLLTGLYGHNSGVMGFMHTKRPITTIMETLGAHGYLTGILGKVEHCTPKADYRWDFCHDMNELGRGRDPEKYYNYCVEFFNRCRSENKPFFFMVNSHDPHRPYHIPGKPFADSAEPSKTYKPADVPVPGFVPDLPGVRKELSHYLNSTRRCDDTVGRALDALKESGLEDSTIVVFLSDNGIAIPFAKCNTYLASTHTPWIVRWPGKVAPGSVDSEHFISGIDFFPTMLDALHIDISQKLDGKSFLPLLRGEKQEGRNRVYTQIDRQAGPIAYPMRCVQDKKFGYIFNAWSDGQLDYHNNNEGKTMAAMKRAAKKDPAIAERVRAFRYRWPEELYDLEKDPDCLVNLIDKPEYREQADRMRAEMRRWMVENGDPMLPAFDNRDNPEIVKETILKVYGPNKPFKKKRKNRKRRSK